MKKNLQNWLFIIIVLVVVYIFFSHLIHHTPTVVDKRFIVECTTVGKSWEMAITDEGFSPKKLTVKTCDRLVFVNRGTKYHEPAFGDHPIHLIYPGFRELVMKPNDSNSLILTAYGTYRFHDHIYEKQESKLVIIK